MPRTLTAHARKSLLRVAASLPVGNPARRYILGSLKVALRLKQMEGMMKLGRSFGILSAYGTGSKKENQKRNGELYAQLQKMGYRIHPLKGSWEGVSEKSVLVPKMKFRDLVRLGREFDQISVIYKDKSGVLGMYYLQSNEVEFAVHEDGAIAAAWEANKDLYSKARGISFEFGFLWGQKLPWNGSTPYTRRGLTKVLESGQLRF